MSSKVLRHPDKEEVIKKLLNGESVKEVEEWLKKKHPRQKRLHVSYMTLQKFRAEHLNIKGEVLEDIRNKRLQQDKEDVEVAAKIAIANSPHYQDKLNQIVSQEIDVARRLVEMDKLISSRIEHYYNVLATGGSMKEDRIFIDYINTLKGIMQDWKKYIEGVADKKIEHNVSVQVVDSQVNIIKEAVYEVLEELSPELVPIFIDKLGKKVLSLNHNSQAAFPSKLNKQYIIDVDNDYEE